MGQNAHTPGLTELEAEMLAALKTLLKDYLAVFEDHPEIEVGWRAEESALVKSCRAAIAKAEGVPEPLPDPIIRDESSMLD